MLGPRTASTVHDVAYPGLAVPGNDRFVRIPGFAVLVHRGTVVDNPAVGGPGEGPVGEQADAGLVLCLAVLLPGHQIALFGPRAGMQPVAAGRGAVSLKHHKVGHLLSGFVFLVADLHVAGEVTVHDLGHLGRAEGMAFLPAVDAQLQHRLRESAALLVELADFLHQLQHDVAVGLGFAPGGGPGIAPGRLRS